MNNYRTLNADVILGDTFQRLSSSAKALYLLLFFKADEYGFVDKVFKVAAENKFSGNNLDELCNTKFIMIFDDESALIGDYFLQSGASIRIDPKRTIYSETTIDERGCFVPHGKETIKPRKRSSFIPPTLDEVKAYAAERKSPVNPVEFYTYFTTPNENGETWVDAKGQKVVNWKQKFCTWEKSRKMKGGQYGRNNYSNTVKSTEGCPEGHNGRPHIKSALDGAIQGR